jgi:hypothetical protein
MTTRRARFIPVIMIVMAVVLRVSDDDRPDSRNAFVAIGYVGEVAGDAVHCEYPEQSSQGHEQGGAPEI